MYLTVNVTRNDISAGKSKFMTGYPVLRAILRALRVGRPLDGKNGCMAAQAVLRVADVFPSCVYFYYGGRGKSPSRYNRAVFSREVSNWITAYNQVAFNGSSRADDAAKNISPIKFRLRVRAQVVSAVRKELRAFCLTTPRGCVYTGH